MSEITLDIIEKLGFLNEPHRYKVAYGGRGAGKSHSFARMLLVKTIKDPLRILCTRELQVSIADSVHKVLSDLINELGLNHHFDVQHTTIRGTNGSEFIFAGLKMNVSKIRSMEGVDIVWVEEAEAVSEESWQVLIPTIRKEGSEIWISFNANKETDPTYKRFVESPPPDAVVVNVNWDDNPWFPETLRREKDYLYRVDPEAAAHVWGGKTRKINQAQVLFGKVSIAPFTPGSSWGGPYQGADWGFANDPTVLVRCWIREYEEGKLTLQDLHIEYEAYGVGVEISETPALFNSVPSACKYVTRADSARPETISHMKQHGYPLMAAAEKGPGSVEDGVMHLRSFARIVIHPRCVHVIQEARLWSYKTDPRSGDVLPVLIDKNDHCWDAARYALEPIMRKRMVTYGYTSAQKRDNVTRQTKRTGGGFRSRRGGIL